MPWDKELPSLYGNAFFASHPAEEKRAFAWLADLRRRGVGWKAVSQQIYDYLCRESGGKIANDEHREYVESEIARAERYMRPWLLD